MKERNPFNINRPAFKELKNLIGRDEIIEELDNFVSNEDCGCVQIVGVEGSGKTSLLNSYFSYQRRAGMLIEYNTLICSLLLEAQGSCDDFNNYLFNKLKDSVEILKYTLEDDLKSGYDSDLVREYIKDLYKILDAFENESRTTNSPKKKYESIVEKIYRFFDYRIALVIDGFEHFTTSKFITQEHHNNLRHLVECGYLKCLVATNCDLEKTSFPPEVGNSIYLENFSYPVSMEGYTRDNVEEFLFSRLEGREIQFTKDWIDFIYEQTGGIPKLVEIAAYYLYEELQKNIELSRTAFWTILCKETAYIYKGWFKYLTEDHLKVLKMFDLGNNSPLDTDIWCNSNAFDKNLENARTMLTNRGFLTYDYRYERYKLNGRMLQGIIKCWAIDTDTLDEIVKRNPLVAEPELVGSEIPSVVVPNIVVGEQGQVVIVYGDYISTTTYNFTDAQLNDCLATVLDLSDEDKKKAFIKAFNKKVSDIRFSEETSSDYEQKISEIIPSYKPGDEVQVKDYFEESLERLREKDNIIKSITDEKLDTLSPRCQYYLKSAVIMDDRIGELCEMVDKDHTTRMVYYAKCLEQSMRDSFFKLFHDCDPYNNYDTFNHKHTSSPKEGFFGNKDNVEDTMLGNYEHIMRDLSNLLASESVLVCDKLENHSHLQMNEVEWQTWWSRYATILSSAKDIRNKVHAGSKKVRKVDINNLKHYLFSENGILWNNFIGFLLYEKKTGYKLFQNGKYDPEELMNEPQVSLSEILNPIFKEDEVCSNDSFDISLAHTIIPATSDMQYKNGLMTIRRITEDKLEGIIEIGEKYYEGFAYISKWKKIIHTPTSVSDVYEVKINKIFDNGVCLVNPYFKK